MTTIVLLDNIRSVHNVGSIFRTCDAAGVAKLYLCGTTPSPTDRFGRQRNDLAKVALGAERTVPWEYRASSVAAIRQLQDAGVRVIAVEQTKDAKAYTSLDAALPTAFVFGNEVSGVSEEALTHVDGTVEIAMRGRKESLNVAVAVGIVLFEMLRKGGDQYST